MKKIFVFFLCFSFIVVMCGCQKKDKVEFTEDYDYSSKKIAYKLPKGHVSSTFHDQGYTCAIYAFYYPTLTEKVHAKEKNLRKKGKKKINGIEYEWYRGKGIYKFIYVTKKKEYHVVFYQCESGYRDDSQAMKFMETVRFLDEE